MLRRLIACACLAIAPNLTMSAARADLADDLTTCETVPDCIAWLDYHRALADWYLAVNLAAWYDALIGGDCGGDLPPCYVMERESGGSLTAESPRSTAAGKWQFLIGTSNNVARAMGRPDLVDVPASHWTELEQDEGARLLWNHGAGCSHWSAC